MENKKKFLIFQETELFYISEKGKLEKNIYISKSVYIYIYTFL